MTSWMIETLLWTAVLIAFVLLVRRRVSRAFGPQLAYALWALPALRLFLPPIELPAWMRLSEQAVAQPEAPVLPVQPQAPVMSDAPAQTMPAADVVTPLVAQGSSFDLSALVGPAIALWLAGATVFLVLRFSAYFRLRRELLENASEMGREGKVRLIETPGTKAPLAFGVLDKVIALPKGFLAQPDRRSRDLALAHELAHHQGRDLLVNVLIQPLFAIHWWNPLGRYGWLALRRDQEAACDARVMADARGEEREVYANLIVSFAARDAFGPNVTPNHALTAPMACPVLGEKSIIHRLRSLKMENPNTPKRVSGKLMLGAAVIALPLTASISYAASETSENAQQEGSDPSVYTATVSRPSNMKDDRQIVVIDPDGNVVTNGSDIASEDGQVFVIETEGEGDDAQKEVRVIMRKDLDGLDSEEKSKARVIRIRKEVEAAGEGGRLSDEEIDEIMEGVREGLEEANETLENLPAVIESALAEADIAQAHADIAIAQADIAQAEAERQRVRFVRRCDGDGTSEIYSSSEGDDGTQVIAFCQKGVMKAALDGLKEARKTLRNSSEMDEASRSRALSEIDRVIERWEDKQS